MTHLTDEILMTYTFDPSRLNDRTQVEIHLAECEECRDRLTLESAIESDLRDQRVWEDVEQFRRRPAGLDDFLTEAGRIEKEDADATRRLAPLLKSPLAFDDADIVSDPRFHTEGVVRKLCAEAERLHDRRPKQSLEYATAAVEIARKLEDGSPGSRRMSTIAIAIREQATALRFLGEFKGALKLLNEAEAILARMPGGVYDLAIAWYVRASVLLQFDQPTESRKALSILENALKVFVEHGDEHRLLRARVLEGALLLYLGRAQEAVNAAERVIALARVLDERKLLAYGFQNAAEALAKLGNLETAERYYADAHALYDELGVSVQKDRTEWELARLLVMRGNLNDGAEALDIARQKLFALGLRDDHALATLDWSEVRLAIGKPEGVAEACRQIILRYESEGMTRNARHALACLQEALRKQVATPQFVHEVRDYLAQLARHPEKPFRASAGFAPS